MTKITESRSIPIAWKIISLADLRSLASLLSDEEANALKDDKNWKELSFSVTSSENATFQSSSIEIFSEKSPISRYKAHRIELSYKERHLDKSITIYINHGDSNYDNIIKVSGSDAKWVNGTISEIESILGTFKPQNNFVLRKSLYLRVFASIGIGASIVYVLDFLAPYMLVKATIKPDEAPSELVKFIQQTYLAKVFFKYFLYYCIGWGFGDALVDRIKGLWPSVEIQVGPDHYQIESKRRKFLATLIFIGFIPLITSAAYDLIKLIPAP